MELNFNNYFKIKTKIQISNNEKIVKITLLEAQLAK